MKTSEEQEISEGLEAIAIKHANACDDPRETIWYYRYSSFKQGFITARKLDIERRYSDNKCAAGIDYVKYSRDMEEKIAHLEYELKSRNDLLTEMTTYLDHSKETVICSTSVFHDIMIEIRKRQQGDSDEV